MLERDCPRPNIYYFILLLLLTIINFFQQAHTIHLFKILDNAFNSAFTIFLPIELPDLNIFLFSAIFPRLPSIALPQRREARLKTEPLEAEPQSNPTSSPQWVVESVCLLLPLPNSRLCPPSNRKYIFIYIYFYLFNWANRKYFLSASSLSACVHLGGGVQPPLPVDFLIT